MQLKNYKTFFAQKLSSLYPKTEIDTFFFLLVEEYLGFQRIDTVLKLGYIITKNQLSSLNIALKRLQKEEPIQYILGKTEFYGLPFLVDKNTLIPRPETEELVEWILAEVSNFQGFRVSKFQGFKVSKFQGFKVSKLTVLDIGTGTGCIPISLAKHLPNTTISAIDVSKKALKIAKKNAQLNAVDIDFFEADVLKIRNLNVIAKEERLKQSQNNFFFNELKFNIIISNPPYVRELEKVTIKNNVLQNEPHLALFVEDNNPLIFYKKIADLAKNHLTKNGILFFEINQYLGKEIVKMLHKKGFKNIEIRKDLFGNNRMVKCGLI
ncbi:MAG: peptide chain release factor N(5)-glutamine methyltransferase [Polaribacter sp.]